MKWTVTAIVMLFLFLWLGANPKHSGRKGKKKEYKNPILLLLLFIYFAQGFFGQGIMKALWFCKVWVLFRRQGGQSLESLGCLPLICVVVNPGS